MNKTDITQKEKPTIHSSLIVIIEDDYVTCDLLQVWLGRAGYEFDVFNSANGVLDYIIETLPMLVLTDVKLPGETNGIELTRLIKNNPKVCDIPVVIHTVDTNHKKRAMDIGASAFIQKPIPRKVFLKILQDTLTTTGKR